jgi:hypothetical protein
MHLTDDIEHDSAQDPPCGELARLARELENAEFRQGIAGLQAEWGRTKDATGTLMRYMRAALDAAYADPTPKMDLATAEANAKRADSEFRWRTTRGRPGGLRRCVDAWARAECARRELAVVRSKTEKEKSNSKRANNKRATEYWRKQLAM